MVSSNAFESSNPTTVYQPPDLDLIETFCVGQSNETNANRIVLKTERRPAEQPVIYRTIGSVWHCKLPLK